MVQNILEQRSDGPCPFRDLLGGKLPIRTGQVEGVGEDFVPSICDLSRVRKAYSVSDEESFLSARTLLKEEGIFAGISSGGACAVALRISHEIEHATIVFIVCDRGDRYLTTGVFPA